MLRWNLNNLFVAFGTALFFFLLNQPNNLGFTPDSVSYYEVAKNITNGYGIVDFQGNPVHHWPPGFSYILAFASNLFSISPLKVGVITNSLIIFSTILILFKIFTKLKIPGSIALILCFIFSISPISSIYILYLSEGLFILITLIGFLFLLEWLDKKRIIFLILCGVTLGISFWVRYAGLYIITGITLYLLIHTREWKSKLHQLLLFSTVIVLTILPWLLFIRQYRTTSRYLNPDDFQIRADSILIFLKTISTWILGNKFGALIVLMGGVFLLIKYHKKTRAYLKFLQQRLKSLQVDFLLPGILILTYILLTFISSFLVHNIEPDNRILAPIYPYFLCLLGLLFKALFLQKEFRKIIWIVCFLLISAYGIRTLPVFIDHYHQGSGFTADKFTYSETLKFAEINYSTKEFIVNDNFIFRIHGSNMKLQNLPLDGNTTGIDQVRQKLNSEEAVLIYLDNVNWRSYFLDRKVILREFSKFKIRKFSDGFIIEAK